MRSGVWRCSAGPGTSSAPSGSTPTVMNAIMDALWPLGVRNVQMPATPLRVWQAIQNTRG
jgi:carbon-monoxide dehydrogenase large subunit